jgi:formylglycine-generating enzyme required for sulfatase activity
MNVFQGTFPGGNTGADGWFGTCPVDAFPENGLGLHNMTGNVWEWCSDWFHPEAYAHDRDHDPRGPAEGTARVMRGGSYLCHESYCTRYRVDARSSSPPDSTTGNLGFRIAAEPSRSDEADHTQLIDGGRD